MPKMRFQSLAVNPSPRKRRRKIVRRVRRDRAPGFRLTAADAYKHSRKVRTAAQARQWADVANSALERGYSEARAIMQADGVLRDRPTRKTNPRKRRGTKRARKVAGKGVRKRNPRRRSPIDRLKASTIQATAANGSTFYWTGERFDTNERKAAKFFTPQAAMRVARDINARTPKELRGSLRVVRP